MVTIYDLRKQLGLTQVEYAAEIGVSPATVYAWEARRSDPTARQLRVIARRSGVPMDEIDFEATNRRDRSKKSGVGDGG